MSFNGNAYVMYHVYPEKLPSPHSCVTVRNIHNLLTISLEGGVGCAKPIKNSGNPYQNVDNTVCDNPPKAKSLVTLCRRRVSSVIFVAFAYVYKILFLHRLGGMCGAVVTSPFDVVKTRLQSSLFRQKHAAVGVSMGAGGGGSIVMGGPPLARPIGLLYNFVETGYIIRYVE